MTLQEGVVDRGFLYRWYKAQKVIYPRFIKEIDALFMDSSVDRDINKKIVELHPDKNTIIASGFSKSNRIKEAQRLGEIEQTINLRKASAG